MYIRSITIDGFRDLHHFETEGLERVVRVKGPTPETTALADAFDLFFSSFYTPAIDGLLRRWQLLGPDEEPDIVGDLIPEQVTWSDTRMARALVASEVNRDLRVTLCLALDPPQFGALRDLAIKEPRLATALADGDDITVSVGALFTNTFDGLSLSVNRFLVGNETFSITAGRPDWMSTFLHGLGRRWHRHRRIPHLAQALLDAALSADRYEGYRAWQEQLAKTYGLVRVARGAGGEPTVLAEDLPLRRFGDDALRTAELAASIHLSGAEIIWFEGEDSWAESTVEGDASALEQVFRVGAEGVVIEAPPMEEAPVRTVRSLQET